MGAGASAAGMPIEERRELYNELRSKYSRSDLDDLAEEEKQAWLEVVEERKEAGAAAEVTAAEAAVVAEAVAKGAAEEVVQEIGVEEEEDHAAAAAVAAAAVAAAAGGILATAAPEVTVRKAAEAAAARTGAASGRKSGWDLSGKDDTGVRPQERQTRLSYLLAAEENDGSGVGVDGDGDDDDSGCPDVGAGEQQVGCPGGVGVRRRTACSRRSSAKLPGWKKTAEEVETPNELCVGDVVRARDKECNGMWFEGVLAAIHDENTFEVEISGDDDDDEGEGAPQRITVGIDDVVRVMPWFCIEVGDMVECQPEGTMSWIRGTVVDIDFSQALYDVALESDIEDDFVDDQVKGGDGGAETNASGANEREHSLTRVPDSRIRKIISGRQSAAKRWKKVYLASYLTGLGRWISSKAD